MVNKMKKVMKNEKGMTLIELLAVIVIIAIIALIAVPAIGNIINNSKDKALLADASTIIDGAKLALSDGACTSAGVCNKDALTPYVDGLKTGLAEGDQVVKNADGTYTLTYAALTTNKGTKYSSKTKTITNKDLATLMGNKD